jgi:hypothetical protein
MSQLFPAKVESVVVEKNDVRHLKKSSLNQTPTIKIKIPKMEPAMKISNSLMAGLSLVRHQLLRRYAKVLAAARPVLRPMLRPMLRPALRLRPMLRPILRPVLRPVLRLRLWLRHVRRLQQYPAPPVTVSPSSGAAPSLHTTRRTNGFLYRGPPLIANTRGHH